ncbi:g5323 [Coccomyxa elongata]
MSFYCSFFGGTRAKPMQRIIRSKSGIRKHDVSSNSRQDAAEIILARPVERVMALSPNPLRGCADDTSVEGGCGQSMQSTSPDWPWPLTSKAKKLTHREAAGVAGLVADYFAEHPNKSHGPCIEPLSAVHLSACTNLTTESPPTHHIGVPGCCVIVGIQPGRAPAVDARMQARRRHLRGEGSQGKAKVKSTAPVSPPAALAPTHTAVGRTPRPRHPCGGASGAPTG